MSNQEIKKILDAHCVPNYQHNGRIFADSMEASTEVFQEVEDMTGWSRCKVYEWLGY